MTGYQTFIIICWIWIFVAVILLPVLLNVSQPYGRHTKYNWGPMINNKLGWFIMEFPALLIPGYFLIFKSDLNNKLVIIAGSLWMIHYVHRSIIFPFQIKTKGKKMPLVITLFAILFNLVNGFLNGYWLANFAPQYDNSLPVTIRFAIGIALFLLGFVINKYHDWLLIKLRKKSGIGYKIPYGGFFKYVSCPNFFGEIISWIGFFIVTLSLPALAFLVWVLANLVTRAMDHHRWYLQKFPEYPKRRKAIFPGLL